MIEILFKLDNQAANDKRGQRRLVFEKRASSDRSLACLLNA